MYIFFFFFFSSRRRHTRSYGDWSSDVCSSDLWAPAVGQWLEVSSSSTFTDFQARRANIRYRPGPGARSEERRVGKEWRGRGGGERWKKKMARKGIGGRFEHEVRMDWV